MLSTISVRTRIWVLAATALVGSCSSESNLRGSYINHDDSSAAFLVQIDEVHDHNISGTISIVGADGTGRLVSRRTPLSGTLDGQALNLTIENGTGSGMATGTVVPAGLQLTLLGNGRSMRLLFKHGDPAEFDKIVADVRTSAARGRQETTAAAIGEEHTKEMTSAQSAIESTADRLLADANAANEKSGQLTNVIAGYPRFVARAAQLRAAAKRVDPSNDMTGRLDDIRWRLSANRDTIADAHADAQGASREVENSSAGDLSRANELLAECDADGRLICTHLTHALAAYMTSVKNLRAAVSQEGTAFDTQRSLF